MAEAQKAVVITGASTGIGWGATKVLIKAGYKVFGSVRKEADAKRLSGEFGANFTPLMFDVTDEKAVRASVATVRNGLGGRKLFGLVNNAGIAVAGPIVYVPVNEFRKQLEVNLTGVVIATQAFAPLLGIEDGLKGKPGRIVNISSVGGTSATPFFSPYNTSKFGLEGLSEGLRREMQIFGIDVVVIAPGAVATPIWDKADEIDVSPYANTAFAEPLDRVRKFAPEQGRRGLKPEVIGRAIKKALTASSPKVRYVVTPDRLQHWIVNTLPKRMVDRIIGRRLGLLPAQTSS